MKELKIITQGTPDTTKIFVDDQQIGYIQRIEYMVHTCPINDCTIKITFPKIVLLNNINHLNLANDVNNIIC